MIVSGSRAGRGRRGPAASALCVQPDQQPSPLSRGKIDAGKDARRPEIGDEVLLELDADEDGEPIPVHVKTLVSRGAKAIAGLAMQPARLH